MREDCEIAAEMDAIAANTEKKEEKSVSDSNGSMTQWQYEMQGRRRFPAVVRPSQGVQSDLGRSIGPYLTAPFFYFF